VELDRLTQEMTAYYELVENQVSFPSVNLLGLPGSGSVPFYRRPEEISEKYSLFILKN
jgi:hypothetical protein